MGIPQRPHKRGMPFDALGMPTAPPAPRQRLAQAKKHQRSMHQSYTPRASPGSCPGPPAPCPHQEKTRFSLVRTPCGRALRDLTGSALRQASFLWGLLAFALLPRAAPWLADELRRRGIAPAAVWAAGTASTAAFRVIADVHWATDTMGGAALGLALALGAVAAAAAVEEGGRVVFGPEKSEGDEAAASRRRTD